MARRCTAHMMSVYGHPRQERTRTVDTVDDDEVVDECECVVIEYFMAAAVAAAEAPTLAVKLLWLSNFCRSLRIHAGTRSRPCAFCSKI